MKKTNYSNYITEASVNPIWNLAIVCSDCVVKEARSTTHKTKSRDLYVVPQLSTSMGGSESVSLYEKYNTITYLNYRIYGPRIFMSKSL